MRPGYVYLMFDGEYHKVGQTINVDRRRLGYWFDGYDMKVLHSSRVIDMDAWEGFFIMELRPYRVKGREWFYLPDDEVSWFEQLPAVVDFLPTDEIAVDVIRPIRYDQRDRKLDPPRHSLEVGYWASKRALMQSKQRQRRAMGDE